MLLSDIWGELPRFFGTPNLVFLARAVGTTLGLAVVACVLGSVVGAVLAALRLPRLVDVPPLRWSVIGFVEAVRRLPFLVLLFLVLFGAQALGSSLPSLTIAGIALVLRAAAVLSETMRAGLEAVHATQWDAAATMNLSRPQQLARVILPQAWRVILPPAMVQLIQLVKATSIASQLSVIELTYAGKLMNQRGFSATLSYGTVLVVYYVLCLGLERLARSMERRLVLPHA